MLAAVTNSLAYMLRLNWTFAVFAVAGLVWFVFWPGKGRGIWERVLVLACAVLMAVGIYGATSNAYIYYGMPFVLFVPLGFLALLGPAQILLKQIPLPAGLLSRVAVAAALVLGVGYALWHSPTGRRFCSRWSRQCNTSSSRWWISPRIGAWPCFICWTAGFTPCAT